MIFPVRCFTCGKVIGHLWEEYNRRVKKGEDPGKVLDDLGVLKECCRRMFISHIEMIDDIIRYEIKFVPSPETKRRIERAK